MNTEWLYMCQYKFTNGIFFEYKKSRRESGVR
nr:MAG TPA: hypothetical protein [Caudoviricetes sp.]